MHALIVWYVLLNLFIYIYIKSFSTCICVYIYIYVYVYIYIYMYIFIYSLHIDTVHFQREFLSQTEWGVFSLFYNFRRRLAGIVPRFREIIHFRLWFFCFLHTLSLRRNALNSDFRLAVFAFSFLYRQFQSLFKAFADPLLRAQRSWGKFMRAKRMEKGANLLKFRFPLLASTVSQIFIPSRRYLLITSKRFLFDHIPYLL